MCIYNTLKNFFPDTPDFKLKGVEKAIMDDLEKAKTDLAIDECTVCGVESASHINLTIKKDDLDKVAKSLYKKYPNFYDVVKFLWVKFPDGNEERLVELVKP